MGIAKLGGKVAVGTCKVIGSALEKSNEYKELMSKRNTNVFAVNNFYKNMDRLSKREGLSNDEVGSEMKYYTERRDNIMYDGVSSDKISVKEHVLSGVNTLGRGFVKGISMTGAGIGAGAKAVTQLGTVQGIKKDVANAYSKVREKTTEGLTSWKENATTGFGKFMSTMLNKVNDVYSKGETMISKAVDKTKEGVSEFKDTVAKSSSYQKLLDAKNNMDRDVTVDNNFNKNRSNAEEVKDNNSVELGA